MIGRGLIARPYMLDTSCLDANCKDTKVDYYKLKNFHDELITSYKEIYCGDLPLINHMKEIWFYMSCNFKDLDIFDKNYKKLKKAKHMHEYSEAVRELFNGYI